MKDDNNMSLMQEILAIMPLTQETAMTSAELFERCKGAETSDQVAKTLSALYIDSILNRIKNAENKNLNAN